LVLFDGSPSNYGNEQSILNCYEEITDGYFQNKNNVNIELATLETGDKRYPEVTVADCGCRLFVERVGDEGHFEAVERLERFDTNRSVPSVGAEGQVHRLAGQGTSEEDTVKARTVAWTKGGRPATEIVGEADKQLETVLQNKLKNDSLVEQVLCNVSD